MIFSYKTEGALLCEQPQACPGCWVHLTAPTRQELDEVIGSTGVLPEFLQAALDEEESPRIEKEDNQTLILVDIPMVEPEGTSYVYNTFPLGIVITENNIITVCLEETTIIEDFFLGRIRGLDCAKKTRFVYQLLFKISSRFLQYLRQIDKAKTQVEAALTKSLKNRELIQMLKLEKSLVFFSTSLKANEIVMEKMLKTNVLKRYRTTKSF
jgi:magnesium transporter